MFAYCNNNPITYTDSEGTRPIPGTTVSDESAEERKASWQYMKQNSISATPLPLAPTPTSNANSIINDINSYVNNTISAFNQAFYLQFGMGFGYGGSISLGSTEIEAQIYFNPANFKYKTTGTQYYSSFYAGVKIVDTGRVIGLEYHLILDWDIKEFINISAEPVRFDDIGIGISAYKHMGIDFFVGVE